jgi:F-type H+-transporting ATPase subunit epsilon
LIPGILVYEQVDPAEDGEQYVALDEGVLVKIGARVLVSVRNAVSDNDLGHLEQLIRDRFHRLDEHEHASRAAMNALEANVIRRFIELNKR